MLLKSQILAAILVAAPVTSLFASPQPAQAYNTAYDYADRMCSMMRNGMSPRQAWGYVVEGGLRQQPGYYGSVGTIIGTGIAHGLRMRGLRNEVARVAGRICPEYPLAFATATSQSDFNHDALDSEPSDPSDYIPE